MNPEHQIKAGNGVYEPSDRAASAAKGATSGIKKPFYGEGMHLDNTTPKEGTTNTKPISGGTPPTSDNQLEPGKDAKNTNVIKKDKI